MLKLDYSKFKMKRTSKKKTASQMRTNSKMMTTYSMVGGVIIAHTAVVYIICIFCADIIGTPDK